MFVGLFAFIGNFIFGSFIIIITVLFASFGMDNSETESSQVKPNYLEMIPIEPIEYDPLQQLYLDIDKEMTYDEVLDLVINTGYKYYENRFNGKNEIKVLLVDENSFQVREEYDELSINFILKRDGDINTYVLGYYVYSNHEKNVNLFEYLDGVYFDFRESSNGQGFYIYNYYIDEEDGYEIIYSNGRTAKTKYLKVDSKADQLLYLHNFPAK